MNKEQHRLDRIQKAVDDHRRCLFGELGSAKRLARGLIDSLCEFSVPTRGMDAERAELNRQDMIKALSSCDSDVFLNITTISTALVNRDSHFFKKIAAGLDQQPKIDWVSGNFGNSPLECIHRAYLYWMRPLTQHWVKAWTHSDYGLFVKAGVEPTKEQLREVAKRLWAIERLMNRKSIDVFFDPTEQQPVAVERQIDKEIETLPKQKWNRLWKQAGLTHLKPGRSGPR